MESLTPAQLELLWAFIEAHRASHLWFWRADYLPQTESELRQALQTIAKRADVKTWQKIWEFESWL